MSHQSLLPSLWNPSAVKAPIKELSFFLSSLDRFLISGLLFSVLACKVLNSKVSHTACTLHAFALVSAQECLMALENTLNSEFFYTDLVICCAT